MPVIYSQRDPQWFDKPLGNSGLVCGHFGCLVTDVAQALTLAGYPDTNPGQVFDQLNAHNAFTDISSASGGGLLIWAKMAEAYPQIHLDGQGVHFVQGTWGRFNHWILKEDSGWLSDPYYGTSSEPVGFTETSSVRTVGIDPAPVATATTVASVSHEFTINLIPDAEWSNRGLDANVYQNRGEVAALQDKLIALGFIGADELQIVESNKGFYGPRTINAVVAFQIAHGIIAAGGSYPGTYAAGFVGPRTRAALTNA